MGKLKLLAIRFPNNPHAVFHPGETAVGNVVVHLSAPMSIKAIRIRFRGEAYAHFTTKVKNKIKKVKTKTTKYEDPITGLTRKKKKKKKKTKTKVKTIHHYARKGYCDNTFVIFGKGSGGSDTVKEVGAGEHSFRFEINVPNHLPSSFEGKYGHIRYSIKATLVKRGLFNESIKRAFTVLDMVDLNLYPRLNIPEREALSKTYGCFCCKSGPVEITVLLNKTGFVPGEFIAITGSIQNYSSRTVRSIKAFIVQRVTYMADGLNHYQQNYVGSIKGPGCPKKDNAVISSLLKVPAVPPTLENSDIIRVNYHLEFEAKMPFGHRNFTTNFGIFIGTVPLESADGSSSAKVVCCDAKQSRVITTATTSAPIPNLEPELPIIVANAPIPAPTFEASVTGEVNIKDDDDKNDHLFGRTRFAPEYIYYNFDPPPLPIPRNDTELTGI